MTATQGGPKEQGGTGKEHMKKVIRYAQNEAAKQVREVQEAQRASY